MNFSITKLVQRHAKSKPPGNKQIKVKAKLEVEKPKAAAPVKAEKPKAAAKKPAAKKKTTKSKS